MTEVVRAASLSGYFDVCREVGIDGDSLLRKAGLSRFLVSTPEQLLPAQVVSDLLERSAEVAGITSFAMRMVEKRNLADLGVVSLLLAHQETLGQALETLARYRARLNTNLTLHVEELDDIVIVREEFSFKGVRAGRQANELALGVLARICATVLGTQWQPELVGFNYPAPPPGERDIYVRVFGCPVQFEEQFNGIVFPVSDLSRKNPKADLSLAIHARNLLESVMETHDQSIVQELEQTILVLLPSGRATIANCANALGLNLRTLQRRLDEEGVTFSDALEEIRAQLVERYLATRRLRLTDIADLLGYSTLGAFSRWYVRRFGETPSAAKRRLSKPVARQS